MCFSVAYFILELGLQSTSNHKGSLVYVHENAPLKVLAAKLKIHLELVIEVLAISNYKKSAGIFSKAFSKECTQSRHLAKTQREHWYISQNEFVIMRFWYFINAIPIRVSPCDFAKC